MVRRPEGRSAWILSPDPDAVLYLIDSVDAYERLVEVCPQRYPGLNALPPHADWRHLGDSAALPFDGVHATQHAIETGDPRFSGWGVESTLWFRWRFSAFVNAGPVTAEFTVEDR
jgi:hypothetical protein